MLVKALPAKSIIVAVGDKDNDMSPFRRSKPPPDDSMRYVVAPCNVPSNAKMRGKTVRSGKPKSLMPTPETDSLNIRRQSNVSAEVRKSIRSSPVTGS